YFDLSMRVRQSQGQVFARLNGQFTATVRALSRNLPVWIVTNLSVRNALPLEPNLFDLVILDEASQCDIASALPLLFRARRALVIGDPRQLRHISALSIEEEGRLAEEYGVAHLIEHWSYNERSLYERAERTTIAQGKEPLFLSEHYRCH